MNSEVINERNLQEATTSKQGTADMIDFYVNLGDRAGIAVRRRAVEGATKDPTGGVPKRSWSIRCVMLFRTKYACGQWEGNGYESGVEIKAGQNSDKPAKAGGKSRT